MKGTNFILFFRLNVDEIEIGTYVDSNYWKFSSNKDNLLDCLKDLDL